MQVINFSFAPSLFLCTFEILYTFIKYFRVEGGNKCRVYPHMLPPEQGGGGVEGTGDCSYEVMSIRRVMVSISFFVQRPW